MALTLPLISFGLTGELYISSTAGAGLPGSWRRALCAGAFLPRQPPGRRRGGRHSSVGEPGCWTKGRGHDCGPGHGAPHGGRGHQGHSGNRGGEPLRRRHCASGIYRPGRGGGRVLYKTVNTMDSMVGYRNDRYRYFGTGAARLDDVCNFLPARLTALLMILLSGVCDLDRRGPGGCFAGTGTATPVPIPPRQSLPWLGPWGSSWGRRLVFWPIAQQEDHRRQPAAGGTCRHSQCDPADDGGQRCGRGLGSDTFGMDWRLRG